MNRIVREHYPVEKLPEDLREGFGEVGDVRVTVERAVQERASSPLLDRIRSARRNNFSSVEDVVAYVRSLREE